MGDKRFMRSLFMLSRLVLCMACGPWGLPAAAPSPARIATQTPLAPGSASPTLMAATSALPPTSIPILDAGIDQLAIGPHGQIHAGGYGNGAQQLPQAQIARWDGETWIVLDNGFQPQVDPLAEGRGQKTEGRKQEQRSWVAELIFMVSRFDVWVLVFSMRQN